MKKDLVLAGTALALSLSGLTLVDYVNHQGLLEDRLQREGIISTCAYAHYLSSWDGPIILTYGLQKAGSTFYQAHDCQSLSKNK